jgi:PAS domain S-box-containing protein
MHTLVDFLERDQDFFETRLVEWSKHCANVPADQIDSMVDGCQRSICESFGLDRSELWQSCDEREGSLLLTHLHQRAGEPRESFAPEATWLPDLNQFAERQDIPLRTNAKAFFPWIFTRVRRGETVVVPGLDDLPKEAARDREMLLRDGIRSVVILPLTVAGKWLGFLSFATSLEDRSWSELQVTRLCLVGEFIAGALARGRAERALRDSHLRFRLLGESAKVGAMEFNLTSGEIWLADKAREIFGLAPGESCNCERFLACIHPDDRTTARRNFEQASTSGDEVRLDFRVVSRQGEVRWVSSRMRSGATSPAGDARLVGISTDVTKDKEAQEALSRSLAEIKALKDRLKAESEYLVETVSLNQSHADVVGRSRCIKKVLQQVEQVAPTNCPVLVTGESGTGKELIARSIHRLSPRGSRSMIVVNCAALPAGLIESELFGRERGAFTGALNSQAGRFEMADQSTIFLDEVAELPLELQSKLLRVLQEGEYARLGNPKTRKVDVRVIAATNRGLAEEVRKQRFREDLYYRLSVFPIELPPLRERVEDIPLLVFSILEELSSRMGKKISKVPRRVMETLERHYWPGNIRELRNVIERGVIISTGDTLRVSLANNPLPSRQPVTLAEVERDHILATLEKTDWHIKGPHGAAKILDLKPGTLYSRMRKLGVPHRRQKDGLLS